MELSTCSALYWEYDGSNFVIFKIGRSTYKTQFYYKGRDQYGTSVPSFDNILDCVVTVLQVHADLESGHRTTKRKLGAFRKYCFAKSIEVQFYV